MATYNVQPETNKIIKEYAEQIGVEAEAALDRLIQTAASRRAALKKYQTTKAPKAEKKAKAPKGTSLAKKTAKPKAKKVAIKVVVDEAKPAAV